MEVSRDFVDSFSPKYDKEQHLHITRYVIFKCIFSSLIATSYPGSLLGARQLTGGKTLVQTGHVVI